MSGNLGDPMLINQLNDLSVKLTQGIKLMGKYGREYADAERVYKVALAKKALELRDKGMPVTLIDKVIYGKVADERFERDTAEVMYKTSQEHINAIKLQIRILDNQIDREYRG